MGNETINMRIPVKFEFRKTNFHGAEGVAEIHCGKARVLGHVIADVGEDYCCRSKSECVQMLRKQIKRAITKATT